MAMSQLLLCVLTIWSVSLHAYGSTLQLLDQPHNITVLAGRRLTLPCNVTASSGSTNNHLVITWQVLHAGTGDTAGGDDKGEGSSGPVDVEPRGSNYRITSIGELRFRRVLVSDAGYYRCIARDSIETVASDYAYLTVHEEVVITRSPRSHHITTGSTLSTSPAMLRCDARAVPYPTITWYRNGVQISNQHGTSPLLRTTLQIDTVHQSPAISVATSTSAVYECVAQNYHIEGSTTVRRHATVTTSTSNGSHVSATSQATCAPYNGTVCLHSIGRQPVYYELHDDTNVTNEEVVIQLANTTLRTMDSFCKTKALLLLCRYAFPECEHSLQPVTPKPICRESCMAVRDMFCFDEWAKIEAYKRKGIYIQHRAHFRLPNCSVLPSRYDYSRIPEGNDQYISTDGACTSVDLFDLTEQKVTVDCYAGDGRYYNGTVNTTMTGLACQSWAHQSPHTHSRTPDVYPLLRGAGNACRNPGGEAQAPWCYTESVDTRWQLCAPPICGINRTLEVQEMGSLNNLFSLETIIIIISVCTISLCVILLTAAACYHIVKRSDHKRYTTPPQDDLNENDITAKLQDNEFYNQNDPADETDEMLLALEYSRNDIVYQCPIGEGAFGCVFKAMAPNITDKAEDTLIAVKVLKHTNMRSDFEREACLMLELAHPNIVRLLGVCTVGEPVCLLFEYMRFGDLKDFLRRHGSSHFIPRHRDDNEAPKLSHGEQLYICRQLADAMVYLSSRGYVHRDLATRNCLVGEDLVVKLSDFGLTRKLTDDYFVGYEEEAIAIRWMPLEAIVYNRFTTKSDVWSFGVVLWEVFSFALLPYYSMTHEQVIHYIKQGKVLSLPDNTPHEIYDVMRRCWETDPETRPSFKSIHKMLQNMEGATMKRNKKNGIPYV